MKELYADTVEKPQHTGVARGQDAVNGAKFTRLSPEIAQPPDC